MSVELIRDLNEKNAYNLSNSKYAFLFIFVCIILSGFSTFVPELRYLKYCGLLFLLIVFLPMSRPIVFYWKKYTAPFLFLFVFYAVFSYKGTMLGFKDMFFILSYLFFFLCFEYEEFNVAKINIVVVLIFILTNVTKMVAGFEWSFVDSVSTLEGASSFVFGFFAIYFLINKNMIFLALNFALLVLSLKRIAVVGFILVLLIYLLPKKYQKFFLSWPSAVALNLIFLVVVLLSSTGYFDPIIREFTGRSPSYATMGRLDLYRDLSLTVLDNISLFIWSGFGPGWAYVFAEKVTKIHGSNLHSDMLKIFCELGGIAFVGFVFFLYRRRCVEQLYFTLYLNILFLTDNVLIYSSVMFFYFILVAKIEFDHGFKTINDRSYRM